ncbi:MAG: flippase-like domain-containing protein [Candidatus Omnitrophica bacterium]|nr:flippase-like domain-containing protein [Candidatus Omnitrophota bacterium]
MKRIVLFILVLLFSLVCLWFTFRDVEFSTFWATISEKASAWPYFLAAGGVMMLNIIFRGFRYHRILASRPEVGLKRSITMTSIMFLGNAILPFRAGEAIRVFLPFKFYRIPIPTSIAFHGADRIFDMIAILVMMALGLLFGGEGIAPEARSQPVSILGSEYTVDQIINNVQRSSLVLLAVGLTGVFLVLFFPEPIKKLIRFFFKPFGETLTGKLTALVDHVHQGVAVFKSPIDFLLAGFWTVLVWWMVILNVQILTSVYGHKLSWAEAGLVVVIVGFAVSAPQAPGYIGPFQIGFKISLMLFGISSEIALAVAWLAWFFQIFPVTLLGFICLFAEGLSMKSFGEAQEVVEHVVEEEHLSP